MCVWIYLYAYVYDVRSGFILIINLLIRTIETSIMLLSIQHTHMAMWSEPHVFIKFSLNFYVHLSPPAQRTLSTLNIEHDVHNKFMYNSYLTHFKSFKHLFLSFIAKEKFAKYINLILNVKLFDLLANYLICMAYDIRMVVMFIKIELKEREKTNTKKVLLKRKCVDVFLSYFWVFKLQKMFQNLKTSKVIKWNRFKVWRKLFFSSSCIRMHHFQSILTRNLFISIFQKYFSSDFQSFKHLLGNKFVVTAFLSKFISIEFQLMSIFCHLKPDMWKHFRIHNSNSVIAQCDKLKQHHKIVIHMFVIWVCQVNNWCSFEYTRLSIDYYYKCIIWYNKLSSIHHIRWTLVKLYK